MAVSEARQVQVVQALVRRGSELLMVLQGASGEEPHWSTPGGLVEPGEVVTEALVRELREETGLMLAGVPELAFVHQVDNRRDGYFATVWSFEVAVEDGAAAAEDPDALVVEARFRPLGEAVDLLAIVEWQTVTVDYLRGALPPGAVVLERRHEDGRLERVAVL